MFFVVLLTNQIAYPHSFNPMYSVAIRTLGTNPLQLKSILKDLAKQTIIPDSITIYIAQGYGRPDFKVAHEEYFWIKKGMMNQRLSNYEDIQSDYLLMLDDDVSLQPNSIEKLLNAMQENDADLIGVDTFQNHKLPLRAKIKAVITNLVFPHFSQKMAFKIHKNGSFSYINNPKKNYYPSQSCSGNAMLWKTKSYRKLRMQDELWLDSLPFAYGDDMLESYKVYKNGLKLGVVFNSGIKHLDTRSASDNFRKSPDYIKNRTKAQFAVWWRTCFNPGSIPLNEKIIAASLFSIKALWLLFGMAQFSLIKLNPHYIIEYIKGLKEGFYFVKSDNFNKIKPYFLQLNNLT